MSARKKPKNTTPNYTITMSLDSYEKDELYLGKLRSNFFGTDFTLYDTGYNPKDTEDKKLWRLQLAGVEYETNFFGLKGPRKFKAHLSGLTESETVRELRPSKKEDGILELANKKGTNNNLITFVNKLPKWSESNFFLLKTIKNRISVLCSRF